MGMKRGLVMAQTVQDNEATREAIERRRAEHHARWEALNAEWAGLGGAELEAQQRGDVDRVLAVRRRGEELGHEIPLAKAAEFEALADLEALEARRYVDDQAALERVAGLRAEREQLDAEIRDEQAGIDQRRGRFKAHVLAETEHRHRAVLIRDAHG